MSQDLEIVIVAYRAATARPKADYETVNRLFHLEHVLVPLGHQLGFGESRGSSGYRQFLEDTDATAPWESDLEGAVDIGGGRVLTVNTVRWQGAASGVPIEARTWTLTTVHDDKIVRTEVYSDPAQALEAAGLSA